MSHIAPWLKMQFRHPTTGALLVGGKLYSYAAGTSTPLVTYNTNVESVPTQNTNPVILDASGEASVWLSSSAYKFILTDADDVVLWTVDNIKHINNLSIATAMLADGSVTTVKIADSNVTTAKIADDAVTTPKILDEAVTLAKVDPAIDLTQLDKAADVVFKDHGGGSVLITPQYPWETPTRLAPPSDLPAGSVNAVAWSPKGDFLATSHEGSPYITFYERIDNALAELSADFTLGAEGLGLAWAPDGKRIFVGDSSGATRPWNRLGRKFFRQLNWADSPPSAGNAVAFSPAGDLLAIAITASPYVKILELSGTALTSLTSSLTGTLDQVLVNIAATAAGTAGGGAPTAAQVDAGIANAVSTIVTGTNTNLREIWTALNQLLLYGRPTEIFNTLSDPADLPTGAGQSVAWSPDGKFLAVAHTTTPYLTIYQRNGTTFTKLANPATLPTGNATKVAWSMKGKFLAVSHTTTPYVTIYERSGTTFTKVADPATLPSGNGRAVAFSPDGRTLAVGHSTSPFLTIYSRSGAVFTKNTDPVDLPANAINDLAFSPNARHLACAVETSSPYIHIYETSGTIPDNAHLTSLELPNG